MSNTCTGVMDWAVAAYPELCSVREYLHRHPELGHQEQQTTSFICEMLRSYDIPILDLGLSTGVAAKISGTIPESCWLYGRISMRCQFKKLQDCHFPPKLLELVMPAVMISILRRC